MKWLVYIGFGLFRRFALRFLADFAFLPVFFAAARFTGARGLGPKSLAATATSAPISIMTTSAAGRRPRLAGRPAISR